MDATTNRIDAPGVTYDARGNVTHANGHVYTYDALNTMTTDTAPGGAVREFVYTVGGERLAVHDVAGQWWNWTVRGLDNKVLREFTSRDGIDGMISSSGWKWTKDYVWRDGLLLATVQPNADRTGTLTYHYHLDHLGTPRLVTDQDGRIAGVHDYHPFGSETEGATNETPLTAMKFTSHERDTTTGQSLDYMHARFYSAAWGRFLSVDPGRDWNLHQPQSWNMYAYVQNNPMNRTDPHWSVRRSSELRRATDAVRITRRTRCSHPRRRNNGERRGRPAAIRQQRYANEAHGFGSANAGKGHRTSTDIDDGTSNRRINASNTERSCSCRRHCIEDECCRERRNCRSRSRRKGCAGGWCNSVRGQNRDC